MSARLSGIKKPDELVTRTENYLGMSPQTNALDSLPTMRQSVQGAEIGIDGLIGNSRSPAIPNIPGQFDIASDPVNASDPVKGPAQSTLDRDSYRMAQAGLGAMEAIGGIINAQATFNQFDSQTRLGIQLAQEQARQIHSNAQFDSLREQTKGQSRGDRARLAAAAQGQSARGDLANTMASNEEVASAQNMMIIELNAMRQVFGIEKKISMAESNVRIAKTNRDTQMVNSVLGAALGANARM